MAKQTTPIHYDMRPNEVNSFSFDYMQQKGYKVTEKDLNALGIGMDAAVFHEVKNIFNASVALDDSIPLQTIPTISNPVQFFQYLVPKAVEFVTQARTLDKIFGRTIAGSFEDEQIVTSTIELTGQAQPYTDTANIPLASWNNSYVTRDIVRFELGLEVGYLEAMRAARMRIDDNAQKKNAVANALAIELNNIGFFGYSNGANNTYGLLNEQSLAPYRTVAQGASGSTLWKDKTFSEITADIATAIRQLRLQLADPSPQLRSRRLRSPLRSPRRRPRHKNRHPSRRQNRLRPRLRRPLPSPTTRSARRGTRRTERGEPR